MGYEKTIIKSVKSNSTQIDPYPFPDFHLYG